MSRNSSGRSTYSYKSQEDFQDEIMDLKRQLARFKEESRTLKVKLRRSEENAARKEKIICNMIDPLKAHLSAKSSKCHSKMSLQKKEVQNSNKSSLSILNHQSMCSRAYRHTAKCSEAPKDCYNVICMEELPHIERKKRCSSKVTTVMEDLHEPHSNAINTVLSLCPVTTKDSRAGNHSNSTIMNDVEVIGRPLNKGCKTRDTSVSQSKSLQKGNNSKRHTKGKARKKKAVTEKNARSLMFELCASSENEEDSFSSYLAMDPSKSIENIKKGLADSVFTQQVPHNSDNCKKCHSKSMRSTGNVNDNTAACKMDSFMKGGKKFLSTWDDCSKVDTKQLGSHRNLKSSCGELLNEGHGLNRDYGSNKFGMYLINEHDEVDDSGCVDVVVAEDGSETLESWREVENKTSPCCLIERRASIFRVDIKKKDPKTGNEIVDDFKSSTENSMVNVADRDEMRQYELSMDADGEVMEHLMEALSVRNELGRNDFEVIETSGEKCLRNTLENLLAVTENNRDCVRKSMKNTGGFQEKSSVKNFYSVSSNCSMTCLTSVLSNESKGLYQKLNSFPHDAAVFSPLNCGIDFGDNVALLGVIPHSPLTSMLAPTFL